MAQAHDFEVVEGVLGLGRQGGNGFSSIHRAASAQTKDGISLDLTGHDGAVACLLKGGFLLNAENGDIESR